MQVLLFQEQFTFTIYNLFQGQGQSQDSCNKRRDSRESEVLISASFKPRAVPRSIFVKCFPSLPRYKSPASESLRQTASTSAKSVESLSSSLISVFLSSRLAAFSWDSVKTAIHRASRNAKQKNKC